MNTFTKMNENESIRAKLLEYSVSEELVKRLEPLQAKDLLEHIEILVNKYGKECGEKFDGNFSWR